METIGGHKVWLKQVVKDHLLQLSHDDLEEKLNATLTKHSLLRSQIRELVHELSNTCEDMSNIHIHCNCVSHHNYQ